MTNISPESPRTGSTLSNKLLSWVLIELSLRDRGCIALFLKHKTERFIINTKGAVRLTKSTKIGM